MIKSMTKIISYPYRAGKTQKQGKRTFISARDNMFPNSIVATSVIDMLGIRGKDLEKSPFLHDDEIDSCAVGAFSRYDNNLFQGEYLC